jgi:glycyl-tRNA synthetase
MSESRNRQDVERFLRNFYVNSAEIYKGRNISGFIDWLPPGAMLRQKITDSWINFFVKRIPNVFITDGSTILPLIVFKASGHLTNFTDPVIKCPKCSNIYRVDHLLKETNGKLICPRDLTDLKDQEIKQKSLMLELTVGLTDEINAALRPETAQNIYINFMNFKAIGLKLPFAIAQIGRSYRNEISPRGSRLREFVQMEIEEFVLPSHLDSHPLYDSVKEIRLPIFYEERTVEIELDEAVKKGLVPNVRLAFWIGREWLWLTNELGLPGDKIRFRVVPPEERAFYSKGTIDVEVNVEDDWVEIIGNAYRTDYDLTVHSKYSGANLSENGVIPHVIEPSFGLDRIAMAVLLLNYDPSPSDRNWPLFRIPYKLSPFEIGIASIHYSDKYINIAEKIDLTLRSLGYVTFKLFEKGKIEAQYAKADALGIPLVVTVDSKTLDENTVTIRNRDTKAQIRVNITEIGQAIKNLLSGGGYEQRI